MRWLKIGLSVIVSVLVVLVVVAVVLPSHYEVERETVIMATPERIHPLVNDLERWPAWEPWREEDPTIKIRRGKTTQGVGAHQSWTGDSGNGALTIIESSLASGLKYNLSFDDGAWLSAASITYQPQGDATRVRWRMRGDVGGNLFARYIGVMMDSLAGPMFERGLEKLKAAAESP